MPKRPTSRKRPETPTSKIKRELLEKLPTKGQQNWNAHLRRIERKKEEHRRELKEQRLRAGFEPPRKGWREKGIDLVTAKKEAVNIGEQLRAKHAFFPPTAEEALKKEIEAYREAIQKERDPRKRYRLQKSLKLLETIRRVAFKEFKSAYEGKRAAV